MDKIVTFPTVSDSLPEVQKTIEEQGVLRIENAVAENELCNLQREFIAAFGGVEKDGITPIELNAGSGVIFKRNKVGRDYPGIGGFFSQRWMQELSEQYWGGPVGLNEDIYILNEVVGTKHLAQDLHFDVQKTLKFFLYLNDVSEENGAFACVPGSHKFTAERRADLGDGISYENREVTRDHPFAENSIVPVEGDAGSLIIFTTEVWHRAGIVSEGERKLMRGHTRSSIGS